MNANTWKRYLRSQKNHNISLRENIVCKNCGTTFNGNFCNLCGEKRFDEHDKSIAHFFHESFHFLTHLDNRFLRSVKLLFSNPGFVSLQVTQGIRRPYFPPLNLFLLGVILYLLFPMLQGLNMPIGMHMQQPYAVLLKPLVAAKLDAYGNDGYAVAEAYSRVSPKIAKILLLIILPLSALVLIILFPRTKKYFFDHLTLSAEINTFYLLLTFFIIPIVHRLVVMVIQQFDNSFENDLNDKITLPIYLLVMSIYSFIVFRRFYGENKLKALYKSLLFLLLHGVVVYLIYKLLLAFIVLLFI